MFELIGVGKRFRDGQHDRWVLNNLSYVFEPQTITTVWGPSGSGKSTLLNLLACLLPLDGGAIRFRDDTKSIELHKLTSRQRLFFRREKIGYIYQFFNLIPTLTVRENIELPLELTGQLSLASSALERIEAMGLAGRLDSFPQRLSGGEQQRVAIARSLAHRPAVLLADEPTGNLDQQNARHVLDVLCETVKEFDATLIIATHDPQVRERADHALELTV